MDYFISKDKSFTCVFLTSINLQALESAIVTSFKIKLKSV